MQRRKALAVATASALTLGSAGLAVAANLGLLAHAEDDPVGKLNATNVSQLSGAPGTSPRVQVIVEDSPASSDPADVTGGSQTGAQSGEVPAATEPAAAPMASSDEATAASSDGVASAAPEGGGATEPPSARRSAAAPAYQPATPPYQPAAPEDRAPVTTARSGSNHDDHPEDDHDDDDHDEDDHPEDDHPEDDHPEDDHDD